MVAPALDTSGHTPPAVEQSAEGLGRKLSLLSLPIWTFGGTI